MLVVLLLFAGMPLMVAGIILLSRWLEGKR